MRSPESAGAKVDADGRGLGGPSLRRARRVAAGALLAAPDVPLAWALAQVAARRLEVDAILTILSRIAIKCALKKTFLTVSEIMLTFKVFSKC